MTTDKRRNRLVTTLVISGFLAVIIALVPGCKEKEGQKTQREKTGSNITFHNGVAVLSLESSARKQAGIAVAPLKAVLFRRRFQAYGTVLQPVPLIEMHNNYIATRASMDKAASALEASGKEYDRLKMLYEKGRNVSMKAVEAAEAAMSSDQAELSASRGALAAAGQTAAAKWGKVIAHWVLSRSTSSKLNRLIELKDVLIKVSLPSDKFITEAPGTIIVRTPGSRSVEAKFIGPAPNADPRIQGASFLYLAPASSGLAPGLNVQCLLPAGPNMRGVLIPYASVIWSQGKAWAYVQMDPEHFARREVAAANPANDGYFVRSGFSPGESIVVTGAQILLSGELLPSEPAGGDEDDEGD